MAEETIIAYPVVGWDAATLPDAQVLLVMHYLPGQPTKPLTTEQMHALSQLHRYGMTASQCDELAELLRDVALRSRLRQSGAS